MSAGPLNLHASAVLAGERALLLRGPSGSGKSSLAAALIRSFGGVLVADDRVIVWRRGDRLVAEPHPAIAGKLELYGHGIVSTPFVARAVLGLVIDLSRERDERLPEAAAQSVDILGVSLPMMTIGRCTSALDRVVDLLAFTDPAQAVGQVTWFSHLRKP